MRHLSVIGLGAMGMGVAQSLLRAGFTVHVFDLRPEVVAKIVEQVALSAPSPAALGATVDALLLLVVNAQPTEEVLFGAEGAAAQLLPRAVKFAFVVLGPVTVQVTEASAATAADVMV